MRSKYSMIDAVVAVGHAVLAQEARLEVRGGDARATLHAAPRRGATVASPAAATRRRRDRDAVPVHVDLLTGDLPGRAATGPARSARPAGRPGDEVQQARLRAGVELELQRGRRPAQEIRSRPGMRMMLPMPNGLQAFSGVCDAWIVPRVGRLAARVVQRHARVVALGGRHHAPAPVLADDRHPGADEIDGRHRTAALAVRGGCRRPRAPVRDTDVRPPQADASATRPPPASTHRRSAPSLDAPPGRWRDRS